MSIAAVSAAPIVPTTSTPDIVTANNAVNNLQPASSDTSDDQTSSVAQSAVGTQSSQDTQTDQTPAPAVYNALAAANSPTVRGTGIDIVT